MRFLLSLPVFFCCFPSAAGAAAPIVHPACTPLRAAQAEPDGWLLLAALVVCMAGRLAAQGRG